MYTGSGKQNVGSNGIYHPASRDHVHFWNDVAGNFLLRKVQHYQFYIQPIIDSLEDIPKVTGLSVKVNRGQDLEATLLVIENCFK